MATERNRTASGRFLRLDSIREVELRLPSPRRYDPEIKHPELILTLSDGAFVCYSGDEALSTWENLISALDENWEIVEEIDAEFTSLPVPALPAEVVH